MFCPKCRAYVSDSTRFCSQCGHDVSGGKPSFASGGAWMPHDRIHDARYPESGVFNQQTPPPRAGANTKRLLPKQLLVIVVRVVPIIIIAVVAVFTMVDKMVSLTSDIVDSYDDRNGGTDDAYYPYYYGSGFRIPYDENVWEAGTYEGKDAFYPAPALRRNPGNRDMVVVIEEGAVDTGRDLSSEDKREEARVEYEAKYRGSLEAEGYVFEINGEKIYPQKNSFESLWETDEERERYNDHNYIYIEAFMDPDNMTRIAGTLFFVANGKGSELVVITSYYGSGEDLPEIWDGFVAFDLEFDQKL